MKLGVNVPNFGPGTDPGSLEAWVRFAEDAGFDLAMVSDHVAVTPDVAALYPAPFYEPFTTLAWMAGRTERIELGTTVTVLPYRSPLLTARMVADVDQFSGGRFVFGVGVGWSEQEYDALGVAFDRRGAITDEYLAAITALWSNDVASYHGEVVSFHDVHSAPAAVRAPHVPIWVGGSSAPAIRRTVRFGDAWHPINAEPDWLRDVGIPRLRDAAGTAGRTVPALCPRTRLRVTEEALDEADRRVGEGHLDQLRSDVDRFAELGAQYLVLDTNPDHPSERRPTDADWTMLATIASHVRG